MRIFSLSFIINIVLLFTQPCQDLVVWVDEGRSKSSVAIQVRQTPDPNEQSEDCSPFCICLCCSLSVSDTSFETAVYGDNPNISIITTTSEYQTPAAKTFQNSIWQPPKA